MSAPQFIFYTVVTQLIMRNHISHNIFWILRNPWTWFFLLIGLLRLMYCFRVPLDTTDLMRNLGYGIEFWRYGIQVYNLAPEDFSPASYSVLWSVHHYTYPAITLLFFAILSLTWPSIFFGKLILTIIAAINCRLIYKLTESRLLSLLYWLHPISIWFGSHEGQFEEMVVFWVLLSLIYLQKRNPLSYLFLAIGIQTKLFPVFLFPYFVWKTYKEGNRFLECAFWYCIGFFPSMIFFFGSQYLDPLFASGYVPNLNHIPWAVLGFQIFPLHPMGIMFIHTLAGVCFLSLSFAFIWKTKELFPYFASLVFVFFVKYNNIAQSWYMLLATPFCLTIENEKHRRVLFILSLAFGVGSIVRMLHPHFKYNNLPEVLYLLEKNMFWVK